MRQTRRRPFRPFRWLPDTRSASALVGLFGFGFCVEIADCLAAHASRSGYPTFDAFLVYFLWLIGISFRLTLWIRAVRIQRAHRFPVGHCQSCGYDLAGNVSGICPECGHTVTPKRVMGSIGTVVSDVTSSSGQITVEREVWDARPTGPIGVIERGMAVKVRAFRGRTLLVSPHKSGPKIK